MVALASTGAMVTGLGAASAGLLCYKPGWAGASAEAAARWGQASGRHAKRAAQWVVDASAQVSASGGSGHGYRGFHAWQLHPHGMAPVIFHARQLHPSWHGSCNFSC